MSASSSFTYVVTATIEVEAASEAEAEELVMGMSACDDEAREYPTYIEIKEVKELV